MLNVKLKHHMARPHALLHEVSIFFFFPLTLFLSLALQIMNDCNKTKRKH